MTLMEMAEVLGGLHTSQLETIELLGAVASRCDWLS